MSELAKKPAATGQRSKRTWLPAADAKARQILREHARDLYAEAEREAHRSQSDSVSAAYVERAAHTVRIRRTTGGVGDVLLSVGTALAGLAGGGLITAAGAEGVAEWVPPASVAMLAVGVGMTAFGAAIKWVRS